MMTVVLCPKAMTDSAKRNGSPASRLTEDIQSTVGEAIPQVEYRLHSPHLPLAVYREVAAHLRQVDGVSTGLLPQTAKTFDYLQSQVGGIWIRYSADSADLCQPQIETILTYYGDRYGQWETLSKQS